MNACYIGAILVILSYLYAVNSFLLPYSGSVFASRRLSRPRIVTANPFFGFAKRGNIDANDREYKASHQKYSARSTVKVEKDRNNLGYMTVKSIEDAVKKLESYTKLSKVKDFINLYRIFAINLAKSLIPSLSDTEKSSVYSLTQTFIAENTAASSFDDLMVIFRNLHFFGFTADNSHEKKLSNLVLSKIQDKYDDFKKQIEEISTQDNRNDRDSRRDGPPANKVHDMERLSNREIDERKKLLRLFSIFILTSLSKLHYSWNDLSKEQQKFLFQLMRKFINDKTMTERHYGEFLASLTGLKMNWKDLEIIEENEGNLQIDLLKRIFSFKYHVKDFVSLRVMLISLGKLHVDIHKLNDKQLFEQMISFLRYSLDNVGNVEDVPRQVCISFFLSVLFSFMILCFLLFFLLLLH
jgi:hypothetical protein